MPICKKVSDRSCKLFTQPNKTRKEKSYSDIKMKFSSKDISCTSVYNLYNISHMDFIGSMRLLTKKKKNYSQRHNILALISKTVLLRVLFAHFRNLFIWLGYKSQEINNTVMLLHTL